MSQPYRCHMQMLGNQLVSGHVNASLRTFKRSATSKTFESLKRSVAPTNKCSSEMKAALLPKSYVEKVGQCT